jgi:hypothetical protein
MQFSPRMTAYSERSASGAAVAVHQSVLLLADLGALLLVLIACVAVLTAWPKSPIAARPSRQYKTDCWQTGADRQQVTTALRRTRREDGCTCESCSDMPGGAKARLYSSC